MARNRIQKHRGLLKGISAALIILGLGVLALSIFMVVNGVMNVSSGGAGRIVEIVFGIILAIASVLGLAVGIYLAVIGRAIVATHGSIAEDNLGKGTVNMNKCNNCGTEIQGNEQFCPNCGKSVLDKQICLSCGCTNTADAKVCTNCGKDLK